MGDSMIENRFLFALDWLHYRLSQFNTMFTIRGTFGNSKYETEINEIYPHSLFAMYQPCLKRLFSLIINRFPCSNVDDTELLQSIYNDIDKLHVSIGTLMLFTTRTREEWDLNSLPLIGVLEILKNITVDPTQPFIDVTKTITRRKAILEQIRDGFTPDFIYEIKDLLNKNIRPPRTRELKIDLPKISGVDNEINIYKIQEHIFSSIFNMLNHENKIIRSKNSAIKAIDLATEFFDACGKARESAQFIAAYGLIALASSEEYDNETMLLKILEYTRKEMDTKEAEKWILSKKGFCKKANGIFVNTFEVPFIPPPNGSRFTFTNHCLKMEPVLFELLTEICKNNRRRKDFK